MKWAWPQVFYGFLFLPLLIFFLVWAWNRKQALIHSLIGPTLREALLKGVSQSRQKAKQVLLVIVIILSLLALARPQWGYRWEEIKRRGVDIMIAVDVSKSMLAQDVSPSRLERARRKISDFLNILQGDRVGLIGFAGRAFVLTPLTLDYGAIRLFTDSLEPGLVPVPGTSVAETIDLAIKSMDQGSPESKVLILMTDGEDLTGDVIPAAKRAHDKGIQIYSLAIGTPEGAPIPEPGGGFKKDKNGSMVITKLDESTLQELARQTGGRFVKSVFNDSDLQEIYRSILGERSEQEFKSGKSKHFTDRYQLFLALALVLLLLETFMSERKRKLET